jgi:hypothetical protein
VLDFDPTSRDRFRQLKKSGLDHAAETFFHDYAVGAQRARDVHRRRSLIS